MALRLIATPIGNPGDITVRALETLKQADVVIGEERREVSTLLKSLGIEGKRLEFLNEHSTPEDVKELVVLCREHEVALVTDCGTPGFCDPGARLVAACRAEGLVSSPVPGASSLMCLLSVSGRDMREFLFRGFLPAEREARAAALREIERERRPVVLMDTPYRMSKLLGELATKFPERRVLLGCDFTQANEQVFEGTAREVAARVGERKAEFILALFPREGSVGAPSVISREERGPRSSRAGSGQGRGPDRGHSHERGSGSGKKPGSPQRDHRRPRR